MRRVEFVVQLWNRDGGELVYLRAAGAALV
jgi:hypothetical protein